MKSWDTIRDSVKHSLCLLGVRGKDGKTDHAVCVVGEWIFDSNLEKALPLTKVSLDICCSSGDGTITEFDSVTRGILLNQRGGSSKRLPTPAIAPQKISPSTDIVSQSLVERIQRCTIADQHCTMRTNSPVLHSQEHFLHIPT